VAYLPRHRRLIYVSAGGIYGCTQEADDCHLLTKLPGIVFELDVNDALQNFTIQVSPNGQVFNLVDLTDAGHYKAGTAVRQ
jgi:hypothetical protein